MDHFVLEVDESRSCIYSFEDACVLFLCELGRVRKVYNRPRVFGSGRVFNLLLAPLVSADELLDLSWLHSFFDKV